MTVSMRGWTYGAEHEWADWPLSTELPAGYGRDTRDVTMVNSNGIANDPTGKLYGYGGEINTPPTSSIQGQVDCLSELKELLPTARVNYRSNLHIHIRAPGLGGDLVGLKRVQTYIHANMPRALMQIEPLPRPSLLDKMSDSEEHQGALRRWRRRRVSHQTLLTKERLKRQLAARTVDEFYNLEVPQSKDGRPLWHCQPRLCVNLRQHKETDTVEFRHFPGTLDERELNVCLEWCHHFLRAALGGVPIEKLLGISAFQTECFPRFPAYCHWQEVRYRATCHDGTNSKEDIAEAIQQIVLQDGTDVPDPANYMEYTSTEEEYKAKHGVAMPRRHA